MYNYCTRRKYWFEKNFDFPFWLDLHVLGVRDFEKHGFAKKSVRESLTLSVYMWQKLCRHPVSSLMNGML